MTQGGVGARGPRPAWPLGYWLEPLRGNSANDAKYFPGCDAEPATLRFGVKPRCGWECGMRCIHWQISVVGPGCVGRWTTALHYRFGVYLIWRGLAPGVLAPGVRSLRRPNHPGLNSVG